MERQLELTAHGLWRDVSARLRQALNETTYQTWFGEARGIELSDETFTIAAPNDFAKCVDRRPFPRADKGRGARDDGQGARDRPTVRRRPRLQPASVPAETRKPAYTDLNPKYTFDSFVIGSSNRFAHAAALAVAEAPAQAYNPLFIYGGTGLGKTHLLQAISQYIAEHSGGLTVHYVTSETFMNNFINSLRDKRIEGFKQRYRTYDLLLIDDIQFFEHKEWIQEEFFHTFNSLYEAGRQIIISSDRPPRSFPTLEERLRSRFEWGLITDIQPPDLETRIAILRKKVKTDGIHIPDPQILTFIASRISTQHPRARGRAHPRGRVLVADRPADDRRARPGRPAGRLPAGRGGGRSRSSGSRSSSRSASASPSRSSAATGARRTSSIRARSRCTSRAS